jgi:hypothetical protein
MVHVTSGAEVRSSQENPALTNFSMAETKGMPGKTFRATTARNRSLSFTPMPGHPERVIKLKPTSDAIPACVLMRDQRVLEFIARITQVNAINAPKGSLRIVLSPLMRHKSQVAGVT